MKNSLFLLFAFTLVPIYSFSQMFGGQVKSSKYGRITALTCASATNNGTLISGTAASGVSSSVPYTGGNGGTYSAQSVASTGVTGLTATLPAGTFANGSGTLTYIISGTPASSGTANFALSIGGQICSLPLTVYGIQPVYPVGSVFCNGVPTIVNDVTNPTTGRIWMDRNLGASQAATSSTDANAYGDLYQWGRRSDGHQCRNSPGFSWLSSSDQPAHGRFIYGPSGNWMSQPSDNLWQGVNGINNPCPSGYRLPSLAEFDAERLTWSSNNDIGAINSPLKLPLAGERNCWYGSIITVDSYGNYWSSSLFGGLSRFISIYSYSADTGLATFRTTGFSVRCIKDLNQPTGSLGNLGCPNAIHSGTLSSGIAASGVSSSVPYTGGNGGTYSAQSVASTGVTGLTATLPAGTFANGSGSLTYTISGTPASSGTASFALSIGGQNCTLTRTVDLPVISITALTCGSATNSGTLTSGTAASGVSSSVPYTGGNGGPHNGQTVTSTGVIGLTATLAAGFFASGSGSLTYTITGTPASSGTASFALSIGGQTCTLSRTVNAAGAGSAASCGATNVHNPALTYGSMTDQDGNLYKTIVIGTQEWMAENLRARTYRNGMVIPQVTDSSQWTAGGNDNTPMMCWYNNDSATYACPYGRLYNWFAVASNNNLCPVGWHVPTDADWITVETQLGGSPIAGSKMKSSGTQYWQSPNTGANNISGFSGLPGGYRYVTGTFSNVVGFGYWWSSTENNMANAWVRALGYDCENEYIGIDYKSAGFSVRCIKDASPSPQGSINSIDCGNATNNGTLISGTAASGVSSSVPYTGGNGGPHNGQSVTSTGVTGLTATLSAGNFANGSGTLTYIISGTPASSGTASFALSIGGQICSLPLTVYGIQPVYPVGSVFCNGVPTIVNDVTNPTTGRIWMDRNLGASQAATGSTDANAYGDLYQWGRGADGHQCRNSGTTTTLSSTDQPSHGNFIMGASDWRSPQNNNLWQGVNGINNPCPIGYRLPTQSEFNSESLSWASGAFASPLKLPNAGGRGFTNGQFVNVQGSGYYWSSTVIGPSSIYLVFYTNYSTTTDLPRANANSVRCIKDVSPSPQGSINSIDCASATNNGTLISGTASSVVSSSVPYTGGNGGTYSAQSIASTGVTGLTATLPAGTFANGSGTLTYTITGTPASSGTASFALSIGGQTCTLTRTVALPIGSITALNCGSATNNGTLTSGTAASGVSSSVPYAGGNGGTHNGQTVTSTGVTGLTATLSAGTFASGSGSITYTISGTPSNSGTASFALSIGGQTCTLTRTVALPIGSITAINCASATNNGTLTSGTAASGVSSSVTYTGGNGGTYSAQSISSTGVTGLTATIPAGTFSSGSGSLTYTISGTPASSGTASFALSIGGQTCTLTRTVNAAQPQYPAGSIFCNGPTAVVEVTNPATGKIWMDRNLGASQAATSSTDAASYGDLYQWGRRSDGHQCRNSATTSTLSSSDQPAHGSFILAPNPPFDWRSSQNDNLWQGVNGVNNPCPNGYRLPTFAELDAERTSWSQNNSAGAFASPLKLPVAGYRFVYSSGSLSNVGSFGRYWSSTVIDTSAIYLYFYSSAANMFYDSRAYGFSVRCLKD